jgi:hypothetical protein
MQAGPAGCNDAKTDRCRAELSRSAVIARWAAGLEDVRFSVANLEWTQPVAFGERFRVFHLPPTASAGAETSSAAMPRIADVPEGPEDKSP